MGLYIPLFNFTIVFTRTVLIMNEPKKLNHFKIVFRHVGSVTERSRAPFFMVNLNLHQLQMMKIEK